jgi:hypothetical protein
MKVYTGRTQSRRAIALCDELGLGEFVNHGELQRRYGREDSSSIAARTRTSWPAGRFDVTRWQRDLR